MQVVLINTSKDIKEIFGSVSPKGQVTIPLVFRKQLGVQAKDRVAFRLENGEVKIAPASSSLETCFQAVPALNIKMSVEKMTEIAADEHAQKIANELP